MHRFRQRSIVVLAALVAPALLVAPTVLAGGGDAEAQRAEAYEAVRQANVEAQQTNGPSNRPDGHAPCVRGVAKGTDFACDRVDLLARVPLSDMGMTFGSDVWGWTAPDGRREWAIMGGIEVTAFVEVTDPKRPVVTGVLPTAGAADNQLWHDIKTVNDHAFIVSEATGSGMQVFDMTRLLDAAPGTTFDEDAFYGMVSSSHNIVSNEERDVVVLVGTDTCMAGLHIVDVSDPTNPTFAGCFEDHGYVHDSQCVVYEGPDAEHHGKLICINAVANFFGFSPEGIDNSISVVDISDPLNPVALSRTPYDGMGDGYSHQGWLTEDQSTFLHNDELDEVFGGVATTTTRIFDVSDLDAPSLTAMTTNGNPAIDHNLFVDGRYVFQGNYTSGLRVFDARNAADGVLPEVGFFDTFPEGDLGGVGGFDGFNSVWGTYPFFEQPHLVAVSTSDRGLFLLKSRTGGR